jgi:hypothetical protein
MRDVMQTSSGSLTQLAEHEGFTLYERIGRGNETWKSLKLVRREGRKRNWWFGWNGERLARCHDVSALTEHEPAIHEWVVAILRSEHDQMVLTEGSKSAANVFAATTRTNFILVWKGFWLVRLIVCPMRMCAGRYGDG